MRLAATNNPKSQCSTACAGSWRCVRYSLNIFRKSPQCSVRSSWWCLLRTQCLHCSTSRAIVRSMLALTAHCGEFPCRSSFVSNGVFRTAAPTNHHCVCSPCCYCCCYEVMLLAPVIKMNVWTMVASSPSFGTTDLRIPTHPPTHPFHSHHEVVLKPRSHENENGNLLLMVAMTVVMTMDISLP